MRSRETLASLMVSSADWPAGSRAGMIHRVHDRRYLARLAPNADSNGSTISSAPMRSRSGSGMRMPHPAAASPAATNDRPLIVSACSSFPMVPPGHGRGSGSSATSLATTCSGSLRSTSASAVGSSRCANTETARA